MAPAQTHLFHRSRRFGQPDRTPICDQILTVDGLDWEQGLLPANAITALEAGKLLYFPRMPFVLSAAEQQLLTPAVRNPKMGDINLGGDRVLKGALGDAQTLVALGEMMSRYRTQSRQLVERVLPHYRQALRMAPTSYRTAKVESRTQSWRTDDRRLHVDAVWSRPNEGERILRISTNLNPDGLPRVWRIGEPFEVVARHFLPRSKKYAAWRARLLRALRLTTTVRTEYDHLMLQLHDGMKADLDYQQDAHQITMTFPAGATWVCFSDQTSHAVMSGQYLLEQTLHLPPHAQYDPGASPLAMLSRLTGRALV